MPGSPFDGQDSRTVGELKCSTPGRCLQSSGGSVPIGVHACLANLDLALLAEPGTELADEVVFEVEVAHVVQRLAELQVEHLDKWMNG